LASTKDGNPAIVENLFHIKAILSFHQTHRGFYSQPSWMLQTPPVFTFLFSLHVFSCLRTIRTITVVMWLTHPASFLFLRLFWPLTQLHPSWLVVQQGTLKDSSSLPVLSDMILCAGEKIFQPFKAKSLHVPQY
jgi:hypothetical protein